jgi:hypothetical protein
MIAMSICCSGARRPKAEQVKSQNAKVKSQNRQLNISALSPLRGEERSVFTFAF